MRAVDIIIKKRDRKELTQAEIEFFIEGYTHGDIPDYQASALAMAILLNGMTAEETKYLTMAMVKSGQVLDLSDIVEIVVDKHSTGGVGDKTSLVVAPAVSACGLPVGKMSGRGLGFSGGTLDKLESIPGFRVDLSIEEFRQQLQDIGIVLTGQTMDLAPADGKLYALRDVTGTVQSIPLIASSIMSKKIAAGANAIVLDVKVGNGAFMNTLEEARELARLMVDIGNLANRKTVALLSDMNQPLGLAVGNALELKEALDVLHGGGPRDFINHCIEVGAYMLLLGKKAHDLNQAKIMVENSIASGEALEKFKLMVKAQGGDVEYVNRPELLTTAKYVRLISSREAGYISEINARIVGEATVALGGGREKKGDRIDHAVGVVIYHKVGDKVGKGEPLFEIHANDTNKADLAEKMVFSAFKFSDQEVTPLPHFYGVID